MKIEETKPYNDSQSKKQQIEEMFNSIAAGYDDFNHNMSLGVDSTWRKHIIDYLKLCHTWPLRMLDVATGTADMALMAAVELGPEEIIGIDISDEMMNVGREKIEAAGLSDIIKLQHEDCASMSFPDKSFDAVVSAFALRNFENISQCLSEMYRVLEDEGHIAVIDLCNPQKFPMKQAFEFYQKYVMSHVSKKFIDEKAASYLDKSMSVVPCGKEMADMFEQAGFKKVEFHVLPFGMCYIYTGTK